jgi:hypothetical protein
VTLSADEPSLTVLHLECQQRTFPPYDGFHSTPSAMLWRHITITTPQGTASFEQTDYGHPGRLNPWEPRGIAPALVPKLAQLRALVEAAASML